MAQEQLPTPAVDPTAWQSRVDTVWADPTASPDAVIARIQELVGELDDADPRGPFELGGAYDAADHPDLAVTHYARAIELGLTGTARAELEVQLASTLRVLGRPDEALAVLRASEPDPALGSAPDAFLALALHSAGHHDEALAVALDALIPHLPRYQRSLRGYTAELRTET